MTYRNLRIHCVEECGTCEGTGYRALYLTLGELNTELRTAGTWKNLPPIEEESG